MARISPKTRKAMKAGTFAGPDRSFPIPDASHARNALARVADKSSDEQSEVRSKVAERFPGIKLGMINR